VKKIGQLLNQKDLNKKKALDEKAIFYVFTKTIKELYGDKGIENIKPFLYNVLTTERSQSFLLFFILPIVI